VFPRLPSSSLLSSISSSDENPLGRTFEINEALQGQKVDVDHHLFVLYAFACLRKNIYK